MFTQRKQREMQGLQEGVHVRACPLIDTVHVIECMYDLNCLKSLNINNIVNHFHE